MRAIRKTALIVSCAIFLHGCASIIGSPSAPVTITTVPAGVKTQIYNNRGVMLVEQTTPFTTLLRKREAKFTLKFDEGDGNTVVASIDKHPAYSYLFGNLIFGGLIGWIIVDPATGAMWRLDRDIYSYDLSSASNGIVTVPPLITPLQRYRVSSVAECAENKYLDDFRIRNCEREVEAYLSKQEKVK